IAAPLPASAADVLATRSQPSCRWRLRDPETGGRSGNGGNAIATQNDKPAKTSGADGSRTHDLLNAIPLAPRHTRLRPPTRGENTEQSPAVLAPVVVACRQVNAQRTRRASAL